MFCIACGKNISEKDKFCIHCGASRTNNIRNSSLETTNSNTGVLLSCSFFKLALMAYFLKLRFVVDEIEFMVSTRDTKFVPLSQGSHRIGVMAGGVKFMAEKSATYIDFELANNEIIEFVGSVPLLAFMKVKLHQKESIGTYNESSSASISKPSEPVIRWDSPNKKVRSFKPKKKLIAIECPGCDAQMKVPKLNELQEVTCSTCGLSGEIEI